MTCKAFSYDYTCTPLDKSRNGPVQVEIFELATKRVVLAYRLPRAHKAWCNASATLMVIAEGPASLAEMQAHYGFAA